MANRFDRWRASVIAISPAQSKETRQVSPSPSLVRCTRSALNLRQMSQADKRRRRMHDDSGGNVREVRRHPSLCLEPFAKRRSAQELGEARYDAPGNEDASSRSQRQGDVTCSAAQESAEQFKGFAADLAIASQRMRDDFTVVSLRHRRAIDPGDGVVRAASSRNRTGCARQRHGAVAAAEPG